MKKKNALHNWLACVVATFAILDGNPCHALVVEIRNTSDNNLSSHVRFATIENTAIRTKANQYMLIRNGSSDLKLFSNNKDWWGDPTQRGGLVLFPDRTYSVRAYWRAFSEPQTNPVFNASTKSEWHVLRDRAEADTITNFADVAIPSFDTTYIYFANEVTDRSPTGTYITELNITDLVASNGNGGGNTNPGSINGFARFNPVFRPYIDKEFAFEFGLSNAGRVELNIFERSGKKIKSITQDLTAGEHEYRWDGQTDSGAAVASGLYIITGEFNGKKESKKFVVIR